MSEKKPNLFMRFRHGLGDQVSFTIVLKHLKHYEPDLEITIESPLGSQEIFKKWVKSSEVVEYPFRKWGWDRVEYCHFPHVRKIYGNRPNTKVTRTLVEVFDLSPIESLYYYDFDASPENQKLAKEYINQIRKGNPVAVVHNGGVSSPQAKDLSKAEEAQLLMSLVDRGYIILRLDFQEGKHVCPFVDQQTIHCPYHLWKRDNREIYADAGLIKELIQNADVFFGIDSGPGHIAAATTTPSHIFWKGHHPGLCFDLSHNTVHILHRNSAKLIDQDFDVWNVAHPYFEEMYDHLYYDDLLNEMDDIVDTCLDELPQDLSHEIKDLRCEGLDIHYGIT